jgi:hypothetical protein
MNGNPDFEKIFSILKKHDVKFVVIGGLAGMYHGSARVTYDIDICYARDPENLAALSRALIELKARLRGAPEGLPFKPDVPTLKTGLNFTFQTSHGDLDILGEVSGVGGFEECRQDAVAGEVAGTNLLVLSLDQLIAAKKASARRKDLEDVRELETLKKIQDRTIPPHA